MKELFFTTGHGLNSSEANHIANVIGEMVQSCFRKLSQFTTVTATVTIDGKQLSKSKANFEESQFCDQAYLAPGLYQLSAWLREAVKAKEQMLRDTESSQCPPYMLEQFTKEPPLRPIEQRDVDFTWGLEQLDVKARSRYLALEAKAAAIGKVIHDGGDLARLRAELSLPALDWVRAPDGKNYPVEVNVDEQMQKSVEKLFMEMQREHREASKRLNAIKHQVNELVTQENVNRRRSNVAAYKAWESDYAGWGREQEECNARNAAAMQEWRRQQVEERGRIAALKVLIPDSLQEVLNTVLLGMNPPE
jgi:hypothetical protein